MRYLFFALICWLLSLTACQEAGDTEKYYKRPAAELNYLETSQARNRNLLMMTGL